MKLRGFLLLIILLSFSGVLYAETPWSYTLAVSGQDYTWTDEHSGTLIQEQMIGLEIRGSAILNPMGFYYGTYLSFGMPLVSWEYNPVDEVSTYSDSAYDFYASFGIPFGYRWVLPRSLTGVYLGLGPSFQTLFKFNDHIWGSGGVFWEFGIETIKTKGVKFSMGTRMVMAWGSFATDGSVITRQPSVTTTTFFMGLSWRGTRGY